MSLFESQFLRLLQRRLQNLESVNFETDIMVDSILYHTYTFFVLVIGNWAIGYFNPITSIDNANYLV